MHPAHVFLDYTSFIEKMHKASRGHCIGPGGLRCNSKLYTQPLTAQRSVRGAGAQPLPSKAALPIR